MTWIALSAFLGTIPAGAWALIGTLMGGVGLKVVEHWLNRSTDKLAVRRDFRDEIKDLLTRMDTLEAEVTTWKDKYYKGQEDILILKAMIIGAKIDIPDDLSSLRRKE